jgi:hypothetical protein
MTEQNPKRKPGYPAGKARSIDDRLRRSIAALEKSAKARTENKLREALRDEK